jgi:FAD/FMN-containing dehydrogenase
MLMTAVMIKHISNFGGNVSFSPRHYFRPESDAEVLAILDRHARGKIRVVGSRHAWSDAIESTDVLIDLRRMRRVAIERDANGTYVDVGGGCKIKRLLRILHARTDATLPSLGLIEEQTIAGAISTGTHGSGKHSLSHYMDEIRVAAFDADSGKARIFVCRDGPELRAARCALGCMGIIVSVRIRCVPKYAVAEITESCESMDEVVQGESEHPIQQFYLMPHRWSYYAQRRKPLPPAEQGWMARLYRTYWFFNIDVGMHWIIKLLASGWRSPAAIRFFFRRVLPFLVLQNITFVDQSHRMLLMEHELFKHLEIEIFVPASALHAAGDFVSAVLAYSDGAMDTIPAAISQRLRTIQMEERLRELHGTFTHHYPICIRRVLPDDTLISMTAGSAEPYYAFSFITYVEPRASFFAVASFLARSMTALFRARLHWGKYFPLEHADIAELYPELPEFRRLCQRTDPHGVFRNAFVDRVLGFARAGNSSS